MGYLEDYEPAGGLQVAAPTKGRNAGGDATEAFNITLSFGSGLSTSQKAVFTSAAARWEAIITAGLPNEGSIDDIRIDASGVAIDGVSGILGQAGPDAVRNGTFLPYRGTMQFDTADLTSMESNGSLNNVITHEMGHVLGIGTIWDLKNLTANPNTSSWNFTGANALAQYKALIGSNSATSVPVENTGGSGTAGGHWREATFNRELMTGYLNSGSNPLSRMTAASMIDLGYSGINIDATDVYTMTNAAPVIGAMNVNLGNVVAGTTVTFSVASATDASGIGSLRFYRESNGITGATAAASLQSAGTVTLDTQVGSVGAGTLSLPFSTAGLATGSYTFYARAFDVFGMPSNVQQVTLSITGVAPPAAPSTPDLDAASDTGTSQTDDVTDDNTPTFVGTAEPGTTVTLYADTLFAGSTVATANGDWTITTPELADGTYDFTATASNNGGPGPASAALTVTIDALQLSTPALAAASDFGISDTDRITNDNTPTFVGTAAVGATVTLYENQTILGSTVVASDGTWSITTTPLLDGHHDITASASNGGGSGPRSATVSVTIDTVGLTVQGTTYDRLVSQDIRVGLTSASAATLAGTGITLVNTTTGNSPVAIDRLQVTGNVVSIQVDALLATGIYQVTIPASAITDVAGNGLASPISFTFRQLNGDADDNGTVDFADLLILAQYYGQSGKSYLQGNYDYSPDGAVGFDDLLIVAQNYGVTLFSSTPIVASPVTAGKTTAVASSRRRSTASDVLA